MKSGIEILIREIKKDFICNEAKYYDKIYIKEAQRKYVKWTLSEYSSFFKSKIELFYDDPILSYYAK